MKKFLVLFTLVSISLPVSAVQMQQSQMNQQSGGSNQKVYDQYGSMQATYKPQSNGSTRVYGKYGSYQGQYRKDGSKLKYYPKK